MAASPCPSAHTPESYVQRVRLDHRASPRQANDQRGRRFPRFSAPIFRAEGGWRRYLVMGIQRVFSKAVWEEKVGYCRALKAGSNIYVTGTAPVDESGKGVHAPGDAYAQAK